MIALLLFVAPSLAQAPPTIERVRIGLPAGRGGVEAGRSRNGSWAPVAVTLKGGAQGNPQGAFRVRVESVDLEELKYHYTIDVPAMAAGSERTVFAYGVPGGDNSPFTVRLETKEGRLVETKPNLVRDSAGAVRPLDVLFLTLGAGLAQMKRAAEKLDRPGKGEAADMETGLRQFAFIEDVALMPDQWFGYAAVDAIVLSTRNPKFVTQLAQESESARRAALLEWVRRGGQLVLAVGSSRQEVSRELLPKMPLIDVKITGSETIKSLPVLSLQWSKLGAQKAMLQNLEITTVVPGRGVHSLVRDGDRPVLVQAACGLGRVVMLTFDLEDPKFSTWEGQEAFWQRLQEEIAPHLSRKGAAGKPFAPFRRAGPGDETRNDLRINLQGGLETFEDVTPIPFGYVALFILFYIALVGPVDYFILKKVFKKLEWTWVTFPLTVIGVSVIAYLVAYSVKGDDLRTNKIDVVDIDLHEPKQVYGQTWFTLFSPRVQAYTLGLEPAADVWADAPPPGAPGPTLALFEGGDQARTGGQGLFTRPYEYAANAAGLRGVPVPVWATRSFTASWRAPLPKKPIIGITDDGGSIRRSRDGRGLVGKLTNQLPVNLQDVTLFYQGRRYTVGTLSPGESRDLDALFGVDAQGQGTPIADFFKDTTLQPGLPLAPSGRAINAKFQQDRSSYLLLKPLLFFRAAERPGETNAGLRPLDQSWRLRPLPEVPPPERPRFRDEVVLVARTPMLSDVAEQVTAHAASPTRLWTGRLPGDGERPTVPGFITQETYVRVFIPVE